MSETSIIERHIDFLLTAAIVGTISILEYKGLIEIVRFSPGLAAGIFTVVIGSSISLLVIFSSYGDAVSNAEDAELLGILRKVFYWPILLSVIGFIVSVLASIISINYNNILYIEFIFTIDEIVTLFMLTLLIYAILSFREVFRVVYYVMVGSERDAS